jgi:hypothetical protein
MLKIYNNGDLESKTPSEKSFPQPSKRKIFFSLSLSFVPRSNPPKAPFVKTDRTFQVGPTNILKILEELIIIS